MSFSHACSSVSGFPTHPLLNGLHLNLLKFPYITKSDFPNDDAKWVENFRQVESSCWVEAGCSPNTQECYGGETNTHIHHSEDEEDEASEHAMEDVEEECLDDECASSLKSRCHQKTGDSSSSSGGMKREPGLSKQHPPASARRQQPGSEISRTSLTDAQESLPCSQATLTSRSDSLSDQDKKLQDRDKQRRAVLDDLPGTIWNHICPHLPLDSILRLRLCSRAINRSIRNSIDLAPPLDKDELERSDTPTRHSSASAPAPAPAKAAETGHQTVTTAAPPVPYYQKYGRQGAAMFPPTPPFSYFEPQGLMHTINKVVGQSTVPTPPLSHRRGHPLEIQIPLSEETLSDSTVPLSPDEEVYTDMWIAAVAPQSNGDEGSAESCAAEPAPPEFSTIDSGEVSVRSYERAKHLELRFLDGSVS
ncbi:uncharacterized protein BKA78DRAFT_296270 [Phyllosticta capitalensis]|uniref:uncharacterized protein n=1 Tax=Phyllosticta capitalensis TaxID=121624 RepID=UPI00313195F4